MTPEQFQKLEELFETARRMSPSKQEAFLDEVCGSDAALLAAARSMLELSRRSGMLLDQQVAPPIDEASPRGTPGALPHPLRLGTYEVIDVLGMGGMGVVYRARQSNPRRTVALKVVHAGAVSPSLQRRFEQEAHLLGLLHHPGIAQIFEAGTAEDPDGTPRPYFAMELVEGTPLMRHADEQTLDTHARIRLLIKVCEAVHHAHGNGVVHRDLKPGNILVDGTGQPKVLDFGVARVLGGGLTTLTQHTAAGQLVGTLPYMSPEQVTGDSSRIDARSDVFTLGVLGYELLSGQLPLEVRGASLPEAARLIRDEEPASLGLVSRTFRGDLDTIIGKAMEKDPDRRYQTALDLASDLGRYLRDEPIVARPASTFYQLRKFARRNRPLVAGIVAVFAVVVIGAIASTALFVQAEQQRQAARWRAYVASIAGAEAAIRGYDVAEARRLLDGAPPELRNWEWRHLYGRLDRSLWTSEAIAPDDRWVNVKDVAFGPDGVTLLSSADDRRIIQWDAATGEQLRVVVEGRSASFPDGHASYLNGVALDPTGTRLATTSADRTAKIWDLRTGGLLATLAADSEAISVAWSPNGRWLVCGSGSGGRGTAEEAIVWETGSWRPRVTLAGQFVAVSPDGTHLATAGKDGSVWLWDAQTHEELARFECGARVEGIGRRQVTFSPDGALLAAGMMDGSIKVWELDSRTERANWMAHRARVRTLAFAPDGRTLASGSADRTIRLWDVETGRHRRTLLGHPGEVIAVAFSGDGRRLASAGSERTIKMWDPQLDDVRTLRAHAAWIHGVVFSPDGRRVVSGAGDVPAADGTVRVWHVESGATLGELRPAAGPDVIRGLDVSPDGATIAIVSRQSRDVTLWDYGSGRTRSLPGAPDWHPSWVGFGPEGDRLAVYHAGQGVRVFDLATGALLASLTEHAEAGWSGTAGFSPDGRLLAASESRSSIGLYDSTTFGRAGSLDPDGEVTSLTHQVRFSPDGRLLAAAYGSGAIRLWRVRSRRLVATLRGPPGGVRSLAFTPDGSRLVAGCYDYTVRLWDVDSGVEVTTLHGHRYIVRCVSVSPDGRWIASGSADETIRLWDGGPVR